ncbi:MAG: MFS transporter [Chloroflexota bacterium]
MPQLRSGFVALSVRNYRLYWIGQIVSLVGTWMQSVSQPWLVLLLGGSPIQLGIVLALQFAPSMVLAPLGGVIADRVDKRRLLMATQSVAMLQAVALFALTVTDVVQIWHVMLLALALGFVNAVDMPVRQSFAADLVSRDQLMGAITLNSASFNLARVLGPAVAGVTLAVFGPAFNFAINAASYGGVLTALWRMDPHEIRRAARPERQPSVRSSLAEGIRYAVRTPTVLWPLVLLGGVSLFGFNFQILLPLFARLTLEMRADGYGALFAAMGLGSLIGSLSLAFIGTRRPLLGFILGGGLGFVVFEALLGLARSPFLVYPLIMLVGLSSMLMINSINVMVQQNVPNELRGRVMALYVTVFAGASPIGGIFVGVVAEWWGAPAGFLLGAALSALFLALIAWQLLFLGKGRTDESVAPATPATA